LPIQTGGKKGGKTSQIPPATLGITKGEREKSEKKKAKGGKFYKLDCIWEKKSPKLRIRPAAMSVTSGLI
jgi:hypothetical protein